jgi:hypothetical protein
MIEAQVQFCHRHQCSMLEYLYNDSYPLTQKEAESDSPPLAFADGCNVNEQRCLYFKDDGLANIQMASLIYFSLIENSESRYAPRTGSDVIENSGNFAILI